jgi:hypothetical protein
VEDASTWRDDYIDDDQVMIEDEQGGEKVTFDGDSYKV